MSLFESFLGFAANNHDKIVAATKLAVRGLPWVTGAVCVFGGIYGLPAYLGITYPKSLVEQLQKNKHLPEAYKLYNTLTGWEEIDKKKYDDIDAVARDMTPTEMNSLVSSFKIK
ncbi:MAG: hypothetical protein ACI4N3_01385 [Alphaproteobacteria bacterium]